MAHRLVGAHLGLGRGGLGLALDSLNRSGALIGNWSEASSRFALVRPIFFAVLSCAALLVPRAAEACACCSDPGSRHDTKSAMSAVEKAELQRIRFGKTAQLYQNDGEGWAKGLVDPAVDYTLTQTTKAGKWSFAFRDANGKTGTLTFTLPKTLERFRTDLQDGQQSPGGGPLLYKEWRVSGAVSGSGIFAASLSKGGTAKLVFQGRGNECDDIEAFGHWMLEVNGPGAHYRFFGKLAAPAK